VQLLETEVHGSRLKRLDLIAHGVRHSVRLPDPAAFPSSDGTSFPIEIGLAIADVVLESGAIASSHQGACDHALVLRFHIEERDVPCTLRIARRVGNGFQRWDAWCRPVAVGSTAPHRSSAAGIPVGLERHPLASVVVAVAAVVSALDPPTLVWRFRLEPMLGQRWAPLAVSPPFTANPHQGATQGEARQILVAYMSRIAGQGWQRQQERGARWFNQRYQMQVRVKLPAQSEVEPR
jgi:hypothetical protein